MTSRNEYISDNILIARYKKEPTVLLIQQVPRYHTHIASSTSFETLSHNMRLEGITRPELAYMLTILQDQMDTVSALVLHNEEERIDMNEEGHVGSL
jgi:phage-related holin